MCGVQEEGIRVHCICWREWFYCDNSGVITSTNVLHMICALPLPQTIPYFDANLWKLKTSSMKKRKKTKYILSRYRGVRRHDTAEYETKWKQIILPLLQLKENFMCFWVTSVCGGCTQQTNIMRLHRLCCRAMNRSPSEGEFKWITFSAWCVYYFLCFGTYQQPAKATFSYGGDGLCFGTSCKH